MILEVFSVHGVGVCGRGLEGGLQGCPYLGVSWSLAGCEVQRLGQPKGTWSPELDTTCWGGEHERHVWGGGGGGVLVGCHNKAFN